MTLIPYYMTASDCISYDYHGGIQGGPESGYINLKRNSGNYMFMVPHHADIKKLK